MRRVSVLAYKSNSTTFHLEILSPLPDYVVVLALERRKVSSMSNGTAAERS